MLLYCKEVYINLKKKQKNQQLLLSRRSELNTPDGLLLRTMHEVVLQNSL